MPYGLPKDIGGDSPSNVQWMHNCIKKTGKEGSSAIAICKAQLIKERRKNSKSEFDRVDQEILTTFLNKRFMFIKNKMSEGYNFKQAKNLFNKKIIEDNYSF